MAADFRRARIKLRDKDFRVVTKARWRTDHIDSETWRGIQSLPDDVSLRTSEFQGSALRQQHELWGAWVEGIGFEPDGGICDDLFWTVAYEVEAEWQATTFAALHGYYRQAIETLRAALERVVIAARFQNDTEQAAFKNWLAGGELIFQHLCDQLHKQYPVIPKLNAALQAQGCLSLVEPKTGSTTNDWLGANYAVLCRYAHVRHGYAHVDLWKSNGPVYDKEAFLLVDSLFRETTGLCWLLAKLARPSMVLPETVSRMFRVGRSAWAKTGRAATRFFSLPSSPSTP